MFLCISPYLSLDYNLLGDCRQHIRNVQRAPLEPGKLWEPCQMPHLLVTVTLCLSRLS